MPLRVTTAETSIMVCQLRHQAVHLLSREDLLFNEIIPETLLPAALKIEQGLNLKRGQQVHVDRPGPKTPYLRTEKYTLNLLRTQPPPTSCNTTNTRSLLALPE